MTQSKRSLAFVPHQSQQHIDALVGAAAANQQFRLMQMAVKKWASENKMFVETAVSLPNILKKCLSAIRGENNE